jgi:hypothetical protein
MMVYYRILIHFSTSPDKIIEQNEKCQKIVFRAVLMEVKKSVLTKILSSQARHRLWLTVETTSVDFISLHLELF